jgi:hypothetical protein
MIFAPLHHRNCMTQGAEILQEYYFLCSLQAHQISLKSEKVKLWTVMIWLWNDIQKQVKFQEFW